MIYTFSLFIPVLRCRHLSQLVRSSSYDLHSQGCLGSLRYYATEAVLRSGVPATFHDRRILSARRR